MYILSNDILYIVEVSNARTRLDATLQLLVDKKDESAERY